MVFVSGVGVCVVMVCVVHVCREIFGVVLVCVALISIGDSGCFVWC